MFSSVTTYPSCLLSVGGESKIAGIPLIRDIQDTKIIDG